MFVREAARAHSKVNEPKICPFVGLLTLLRAWMVFVRSFTLSTITCVELYLCTPIMMRMVMSL